MRCSIICDIGHERIRLVMNETVWNWNETEIFGVKTIDQREKLKILMKLDTNFGHFEWTIVNEM